MRCLSNGFSSALIIVTGSALATSSPALGDDLLLDVDMTLSGIMAALPQDPNNVAPAPPPELTPELSPELTPKLKAPPDWESKNWRSAKVPGVDYAQYAWFGSREGTPTWQFRIFQPKLRIYWDTGSDDPGEIDLFDDGGLTATVNLAEVRLNWSFNKYFADKDGKLLRTGTAGDDPLRVEPSRWSCGFAFGAGITSPADDSPNGMSMASSAPVLLLTTGAYLEYDLSSWKQLIDEAMANPESDKGKLVSEMSDRGIGFSGPKFIIEVGYAWGITTDEGISDIDDGAVYAGVGIHIPF
ncbi:MAG: hypothetical protein GY715_04400 [Planctomycetes bacterium]|nr:hypothetical protein [Planctomycetota bacterium]